MNPRSGPDGFIETMSADRGLPFPAADIHGADAIPMVGSNLAETMPASTLQLRITPGTDAALANGLLNISFKRGYIDEAIIRERPEQHSIGVNKVLAFINLTLALGKPRRSQKENS